MTLTLSLVLGTVFNPPVLEFAQLIVPYREIRRRTRVVGTFPDGESALMLVCARLRHVAGTQWGVKRYMSMKPLEQMDQEKHGTDDCDPA